MRQEFYEAIERCPICGTECIILKRRRYAEKQNQYYINGMPKNKEKMENIIDSSLHLCEKCGYVDLSFNTDTNPEMLKKEQAILDDPKYKRLLNSTNTDPLMKKVLLYMYKYRDITKHLGVSNYLYWLCYRRKLGDQNIKHARQVAIDFYEQAVKKDCDNKPYITASLYEKKHNALVLSDLYRQNGQFIKASRTLHIFWAIGFPECGPNGKELKKLYRKEKRAIRMFARRHI